jgi:hypothetical protein
MELEWTVYSHFKPPTIIEEDGKVTYVFVCKMHFSFPAFCFFPLTGSAIVDHPQLKSLLFAMTTAQCHAKSCTGITATDFGSIATFVQGSTYTPQKFQMKIAFWVMHRHCPFAMVEDDELVDIFMDLNNKVEVLLLFTVSQDVKEIFELSQLKVAEILKVHTITSSCFLI